MEITSKNEYDNFIHMLNFIFDNTNKYYELRENKVIFYEGIFDDILLEFRFDDKLNCYLFYSDYSLEYVKDNNYRDYILDVFNIIKNFQLTIYTKKRIRKNDSTKQK